MRILIFCVV